MHGLNTSKHSKTKEKIKQISSPKKERQNNNSNPAIIINEQDESILYEIYLNRLHPPPIGTFSKDLNFDNNLNFTALSPVIKNNKKIILGDGSFSVVQLYEDKKTRIKYAVKKMNIEKVEKITKNKKLVNTEVKIHGRITHPNIIKLYNFFQVKNFCYLILEYAPNKTLFDIIRSSGGLSEIYSFYYFIQTLNAIYFLHLHSIIHRDLKPENLLINEKNIIKLCDFGWSVQLNNNKRTTFCGTVEYMAPEIIKKQEYDESIDVWSLGVLLYELIHSYSPFFSKDLDVKKIGNNITNNNLKFKEGLSQEYKDLVQSLLIKESNERIKIEDIFQHPFMIKYINKIYIQVNIKDKNNKSNFNSSKTAKKKIIKKNIENRNNVSKKEGSPRETNTNAIFESIPNEPIPKILPVSNLFDKDIKKIKTNAFDLNKKIPELNLKTSSDEPNTAIKKNIKKENTLFKSQNKISHVKSFSLGQNDPTFKDLSENRLKIIISINNTQNKNYINKSKNRNKSKNILAHHKKSLSNYFQDNYGINNPNLSLFNNINPLQQSVNIENRNNIIKISSKNNKNINQNQINYKTNSNREIKFRKIFYNDLGSNYTKTDNNLPYQYISMINSNNTNNYSNIIINNNESNSNIKKIKHGINKKLKISNSNYKNMKYLCKVNSDSQKNILKNNYIKNNTTSKNKSISSNKKVKKINNNLFKNKNIFQSSIDNIHKNVKISFIDKILNSNSKVLNSISDKSGNKNESDKNDTVPNL